MLTNTKNSVTTFILICKNVYLFSSNPWYFDVSACFLFFSRIDITYVRSVVLETVSLTQGHLLPKAVHSTVRQFTVHVECS